jgi:hypothetical protein
VIAEATKVCPKCGEERPRSQFYKDKRNRTGLRSWCKECEAESVRIYRSTGEGQKKYRLANLQHRQTNPSRYLYLNTKRNAQKRGLSFTLTEEWFVEKLNAGVCELTGLPFGTVAGNDPYAPSPDRIVNEIGYEDGNGRMILWWLNAAKGAMPEDQFQRCIADLVEAMRDRV